MLRKILRKIPVAAIALSVIVIIGGCKVDAELWVNKTGTGHGVIKIEGAQELSKADIERELKNSFEIESLKDKGNGDYTAKVTWSDIRKIGGMETDKDGMVRLTIKNNDSGSTTVHVDGTIDKNKTNVEVKGSDTVVIKGSNLFGAPRVIVYKPGASSSNIPPGILIVIGIVIVGFVAFVLIKKRGSNINRFVSVISKNPRFCIKCGAQIQKEDTFCGECGNKVV